MGFPETALKWNTIFVHVPGVWINMPIERYVMFYECSCLYANKVYFNFACNYRHVDNLLIQSKNVSTLEHPC